MKNNIDSNFNNPKLDNLLKTEGFDFTKQNIEEFSKQAKKV
jgi:hypothetical protein